MNDLSRENIIVKKGELLNVVHQRKGAFTGIATRDFNTSDEWYPIAVAQSKSVIGQSTDWEEGEQIPCRAMFCRLSPYVEK